MTPYLTPHKSNDFQVDYRYQRQIIKMVEENNQVHGVRIYPAGHKEG